MLMFGAVFGTPCPAALPQANATVTAPMTSTGPILASRSRPTKPTLEHAVVFFMSLDLVGTHFWEKTTLEYGKSGWVSKHEVQTVL